MDDLIPRLPHPWVFDGYRRVYVEATPTDLWQARAIDLTDVEVEKETGRVKASFKVGQGKSFAEARDVLVAMFE